MTPGTRVRTLRMVDYHYRDLKLPAGSEGTVKRTTMTGKAVVKFECHRKPVVVNVADLEEMKA